MTISEKLLSIIICPISGEKLFYNKQRNLLINRKDNIAYPVVDGIPILLKAEVIKLEG